MHPQQAARPHPTSRSSRDAARSLRPRTRAESVLSPPPPPPPQNHRQLEPQRPIGAGNAPPTVVADAASPPSFSMHSFDNAAGVPAFLAKLWRLVEDPDTNHLIYWQQDGHSFIIQNQAQFARELLPLNYKHNNMASFIRQLNMYGFHKIASIDNGGLKFDKDEMEFSHPCFRKDSPFLLEHIKRKIANPKPTSVQSAQATAAAIAAAATAAAEAETRSAGIRPETVHKVMNEVKMMRARQESLDSRFSSMKQENEALWREVAMLRQKHAKQQQIVNKLIQFLVTLVQPTRPGSGINSMNGVKRRFQLMINDVPAAGSAAKAHSRANGANAANRSSDAADQPQMPAISELTDELMENYDFEDFGTASPNVMSPASAGTSSLMADDAVGHYGGGANVHYADQSGTTIVDHPDTDTDDEQLHKPIVRDGQLYFTEDGIVHSVAASPTSEWLEQHMLSPQMIKKEYDGAGRDHQAAGEYYVTDDAVEPQTADSPIVHAAQMAEHPAKRARTTNAQQQPLKINVAKANARGLQLPIATNSRPAQQQRRNPMISGAQRTTSSSSANVVMPSGTRGTKRTAPIASVAATPSNGYVNRSDFVGAELPADLFDSASSANNGNSTILGNGSFARIGANGSNSSLLLGDTASANFNPTLSENLARRILGDGLGSDGTSTVAESNDNMALAKYGTNGNGGKHNGVVEEVNMQLDNIQGDLESMKDLFKGDEYTLDTSALMGGKNRLLLSPTVDSELLTKIFSDLDSPYGLSMNPDFPIDTRRHDDASGSELMMYQPNHQMDLNQLLCDVNSHDTHDDETEQNEEPDYYSQDLNTPLVEKKSISFRPNRYNNNA